jgi:carbon-monoxide dehydrogenase large subunit
MTLQILPRGKWVGARVKRVEDPRFLTGEARYLADIQIPGTVHAAFVRSPYGHARIRRIETSAAEALPGVIAVYTAEDVAALPPLASGLPIEGLKPTPQSVLAKDKVRFVGEAVAVVVAENRYIAEDAAELVEVEYEPLPAVTHAERAMAADAPILHEDLGTNVVYQKVTTLGDVEGAFAQADRVFRRRFHTNRFVASPMETRGCLSVYERASGQLTFYSSTQMPHMLRLFLSLFLGIPEHKVRVISPEVGGGFGQKMTIYPEEVVIAYLGKVLGRPVKWVEDRRENLAAATHAKEQIIELEAAVRADGKVLGMKARLIGDGGAYSFNTASALIEPLAAAGIVPGVYDIAAYQHEVIAVCTNKAPVGAFRAVGWTAAQTARELFFDEIARELGLDPAEFRRRNLISEFPHTTVTGMVYDSGSYRESLERALQLVGYDELRRRQAELRQQGRYLGIGISLYVEPTAWGSEIALQAGFPFPSHDNATVTIDPTGKVRVAVSVHSHGQGHETTLAQVAAEILGVSIDDVIVEHGDTERAPLGHGHLCESKRGHRWWHGGTGSAGSAREGAARRQSPPRGGAGRSRDPRRHRLRSRRTGSLFEHVPGCLRSLFGRTRAGGGGGAAAFGDQVLRSTGHVFERMHRYRLRGGRRDGSRPARQDRGGRRLWHDAQPDDRRRSGDGCDRSRDRRCALRGDGLRRERAAAHR